MVTWHQTFGPPGCGKTTWITQQVEEMVKNNKSIILSSLTRAAAKTLKRRGLPLEEERIGTLHAHCLRSLKYPKLTTGKNLKKWNDEVGKQWQVGRLDNTEVSTDIKETCECLQARCVPVEAWPEHLQEFWAKWTKWKNDNDLLDFSDLIYQAGLYCLPPHDAEVMFIDEAQDISEFEMNHLIKQWGLHLDDIYLVGDPYQNLYEWRGTTPDVFLSPDFEVEPWNKHQLKKSWRVPEKIYQISMGWIKEHRDYEPFEYEPKPGGELIRKHQFHPSRAIKYAIETPGTHLFLATCGFMHLELIKELKAQGLPFSNPYAKHRADWNPMGYSNGLTAAARIKNLFVQSTHIHGKDARSWTYKELWSLCEPLSAKWFKRGAKSSMDILASQRPGDEVAYEHIEGWFGEDLFCNLDENNIETYKPYIMESWKNKFAYAFNVIKQHGMRAIIDPPRFYIGTIHSVKGGEADTVHLRTQLSAAGSYEWTSGKRDETRRQFYVGITRAVERLIIYNDGKEIRL